MSEHLSARENAILAVERDELNPNHLDQLGRPVHDKAWHLSQPSQLCPVPDDGNNRDHPPTRHRGSVAGPPPLGGGRTDQPPDYPNDDWLEELARTQQALELERAEETETA
jgi:hypothetical protein